MYSKLPVKWGTAITLSIVVLCHIAPAFSAQSVQLSVVPDRCVSLLKGKTCYQVVQFRWQIQHIDVANVNKKICLWREGDSVALTCWDDEADGVFQYNLEAAETTNFHLVTGSQQQPIVGSTTVTVNWVYKKRRSRSSRWRLF